MYRAVVAGQNARNRAGSAADSNAELKEKKEPSLLQKVGKFASWVFHKYIEHPELKGWAPNNRLGRLYLKIAMKAEEITISNRFNGFIIGCICVAGILVGLQTYPSMDGHIVTSTLDYIILAIFGVEVILKIVAEAFRPWLYFMNKEWRWNNFDFWIVMLCLPIFNIGGSGNSVALLRLLRLMRVIKIVKKVPQLQMIVMGLIGGLSSIGYILLLLFLVFYLFAISGYHIFATNDPWHFKDILIAHVTLFRACTFEDWTDLFYINYYGCDQYLNVYIIDENEKTEDNEEYWCENPERRNLIGWPYWILFIVIAGLVMLALFIGAVTMSMQASMHELKLEKEHAQQEKKDARMKKKLMEQNSLNSIDTGFGSTSLILQHQESPEQVVDNLVVQVRTVAKLKHMKKQREERQKEMQAQEQLILQQQGMSPKHLLKRHLSRITRRDTFDPHRRVTNVPDLLRWKDWQEQSIMKEMLVACWEGKYVDPAHLDALQVIPEMPWPVEKYYALSLICDRIAKNPRFVNMITVVIIGAGILVGVQTFDLSASALIVCNVFENLILSIFTMEVALKIIAENFRPYRFFKTGWNNFDFIIVVGSFLPVNSAGSMLVILRLLRLLRVLKLVKSLPQLAMIVNAMIMGMSSIGFIGIILILVYYLFAIVGMIMFAENDPWHFGSLHYAMLTLFRCSTLEDWSDVMYINMYGCMRYGYDDLPGCSSENSNGQPLAAVLYFIVFTVITALVLLTLFIGVICTSMDEVQQEQDREREVEERLQDFIEEYNVDPKMIGLYRKVFNLLDIDGGGTIEDEELALGLSSAGVSISSEQISQVIQSTLSTDQIELDFASFVNLIYLRQKKQDDKEQQDASNEVKDQDADAEVESITTPSSKDALLSTVVMSGRNKNRGELSPSNSKKQIASGSGGLVLSQGRLLSSARSNSVDSSKSAGSDAPLLGSNYSPNSSRSTSRGVAGVTSAIIARAESPDSLRDSPDSGKRRETNPLSVGTLSSGRPSPRAKVPIISSPKSHLLHNPSDIQKRLVSLSPEFGTKGVPNLKEIKGCNFPDSSLSKEGPTPYESPTTNEDASKGVFGQNRSDPRIIYVSRNHKSQKNDSSYSSQTEIFGNNCLVNCYAPPSPTYPDDVLSEETVSSVNNTDHGSLKNDSTTSSRRGSFH